MKEAKLMVIYLTPADIENFDRFYAEEHVPMARAKLTGMVRFAALFNTKAVSQAIIIF